MAEPRRWDPSTWIGIGVLGLVVFAIGVAIPELPATAHLPFRTYVSIAVAIVGGAVAALGLGNAYDARPGGPAHAKPPPPSAEGPADRSIRTAPSFEIYDPNAPESPEPASRR